MKIKFDKLTDAELNVAVAKELGCKIATKRFRANIGKPARFSTGYRWHDKAGNQLSSGTGQHGWGWHGTKASASNFLPHWSTDERVAHSLARELTRKQHSVYVRVLDAIVNPGAGSHVDLYRMYRILMSSPRQRVLAWLEMRELGRKRKK